MRILLPLHGFVKWNGGLDLIRLIASALTHPAVSGQIELHFAFPEATLTQRFLQAIFRRWRSFRAGNATATGSGGSAAALLEAARNFTTGYDVITCADTSAGILQAAARIDADVVFPSMLPLGKLSQPWIGYLFDFQHRHLPELFSARTRRNRDRHFAKIASTANGIVVNSKSVALDVVRYLGIPMNRVLVMPFSPYVQPWWLDLDPAEVQLRYSIRNPYLLICNHLWKHKDHATAFRAFALLCEEHDCNDLRLVLTGDPIDHRDPQHYGRLMALADSLGITQHMHFLGLIPKRDQIALLRGCRALWQPTLFEGGPGGGSTYEAIGLSVPVVLSDIPINREIDRGHVTFFQAGDPDDLANKTIQLLSAEPRRATRDQLLADSDASMSRLSTAIVGYLDGFKGTSSKKIVAEHNHD
jgi:glycosyltransferase involved in cell wall biosynthesis